ncbi:uncharacterized protein LOC117644924 [Thrips palmi]|uniref:Uncharacterized protein LOC117644924 n=1 Tax=Thrips palmi TaxID=161013 RepID=A0A6P8YSZ0_THRPL|nr:uncharacterized protein LOC117644924 [Thrips palmi]XP_034240534.1 uncharacterized protein LOC117644924 [Thrips palmi]XP_034240535.1 uncharacterized protein LOC117644924 [Thrips palmi]XP_034240536.1 uncharacterized protein LOC117644924 [Thrips palmi]XP_034240537.1 uncharacterized protein LOC117644924 [Thrips palmi]XP_034240538.1 uncharacterized protein LOC117644924 [Thrips palmi]XP_034240539.1 uncharacterized protein LOC117644924 [Thrips palmi]XP_034240540.1 uncharacterized protein LOC1176
MPHRCVVCDKIFSKLKDLTKHFRSHTGEKPYKCEECKKNFSTKGGLRVHIGSHTGEKPFRCAVCNKNFRLKSHLRCHIFTHTGQKPHKCSECGKGFNVKANLRRHIQTHTGEKPYECPVCRARFSERAYVRKHLLTHTGEEPFRCAVCDKGFTMKGNLLRHIRTHTGEKPFGCSVCGARFTERGSARNHLLIHTGEKPYRCAVCSKSFNQKTHLRRHLQTHLRTYTGRKFECKVCHRKFSKRGDLGHHARSHTGEMFECTVRIKKLSESDVAAQIGKWTYEASESDAPEDDKPSLDAPEDGAPSDDEPSDDASENNAPEDDARSDDAPVEPKYDAPEDDAPENESPNYNAPEEPNYDAPAAKRVGKKRSSKAPEAPRPARKAKKRVSNAPQVAPTTAARNRKKVGSKASKADAAARKGRKVSSKASHTSSAAAGSRRSRQKCAEEDSARGEHSQDGPSLAVLPDAVLLQILSWLPVEDLLRAARVCRRWRKLTARPEAWRRADVVVTSSTCKKQMWLLERAPQLRLLDMSGLATADDWGFEHDEAVRDAWERLDCMDCPARQLDIRVERDGCAKIGLLARWGPHLKRLTLRLGTGFCEFGREYGQMQLAIKIVGSSMAQLTHLDLTYEQQEGAPGGYDKELGKGCPSLVSFTFHFPTQRDYGHWKEVVLDVLAHKSGQLTELALLASDKCPEVPAELWPAIGRCTQLRRLAVPTPPGLAVVGQLPLLRDLSLQPSEHASVDEETRELLLAGHAVLGGLQRLELHLPAAPPAASRTYGPGPIRRPTDHMAVLLDDLLSRICSEVRCLCLTGGCYPAAVMAGLLGDVTRMPALTELRLRAVQDMRSGHLQQLAASGRLKVIRLEDVSVKHDMLVWSVDLPGLQHPTE